MTQPDSFKRCFQKSSMKRRSKLADFNKNFKAKFFLVFVKLEKHPVCIFAKYKKKQRCCPKIGNLVIDLHKNLGMSKPLD